MNPTVQILHRMQFSLVGGGQVILQWPSDINGEDIEEAWECVSMQFNTLRRITGERERAEQARRVNATSAESLSG